MNGNILTQYINGLPINQLRFLDIASPPKPQHQVSHNQIEQLERVISRNMDALQGMFLTYKQGLMYVVKIHQNIGKYAKVRVQIKCCRKLSVALEVFKSLETVHFRTKSLHKRTA